MVELVDGKRVVRVEGRLKIKLWERQNVWCVLNVQSIIKGRRWGQENFELVLKAKREGGKI